MSSLFSLALINKSRTPADPSAIEYFYTREIPDFADEESKEAFLEMLEYLNP